MHRNNLPEDLVNKYHLPFSQYRTLGFISLISVHVYYYTKDSVSMRCRSCKKKNVQHTQPFSLLWAYFPLVWNTDIKPVNLFQAKIYKQGVCVFLCSS